MAAVDRAPAKASVLSAEAAAPVGVEAVVALVPAGGAAATAHAVGHLWHCATCDADELLLRTTTKSCSWHFLRSLVEKKYSTPVHRGRSVHSDRHPSKDAAER